MSDGDKACRAWQGAAAALLVLGQASAAPMVMRVCLPDVDLPPYTYRSGRPAGLFDRLLVDAGVQAGLRVQLQRLPSARCRRALQQGDADAMPLPASPLYLDELVFPLRNGRVDAAARMAVLRFVLVRRPGTVPDWDGEKFSPQAPLVGTRLGVGTLADRLQRLGARLDDKAFSNEQLLDKLLAGRIEMAALSQPEFEALRADPRGERVELLERPLLEVDVHLALSQQAALRLPPAQLQAWREQLVRLRDSPAYRAFMP